MTTVNAYATREEWLQSAIELLRDSFPVEVPAFRVSVGFPTGRGGSKNGKAIGQCHYMAADGVPQIFIHPMLTDPVRILDVLVHEVIHAALPVGAGHGKEFGKVARAMGLEGPLTATVASDGLKVELVEVAAVLGVYPHAALDTTNMKKQGTRMLKATCEDHEYTVRISATQAMRGLPLCPCCHEEGELVALILS